MGVSPRRLMGWEPGSVTSYIYEDGRLVRSVTVTEPEFSESDLALLRGHLDDERSARGRHGYPMSEAMSRDGDPANPNRKWDWHVGLPVVDFAQSKLNAVISAYQKEHPEADMDALRWTVEKRER